MIFSAKTVAKDRGEVNARFQRGVASIEYALIASLIALAILAGLSSTGEANGLSWEKWAAKVMQALGA